VTSVVGGRSERSSIYGIVVSVPKASFQFGPLGNNKINDRRYSYEGTTDLHISSYICSWLKIVKVVCISFAYQNKNEIRIKVETVWNILY
jgi:hypothetical protein